MRTELRIAQNTPHPPPSWVLATATALFGVALGLLPMGVIGVRTTLRLWRERLNNETVSARVEEVPRDQGAVPPSQSRPLTP